MTGQIAKHELFYLCKILPITTQNEPMAHTHYHLQDIQLINMPQQYFINCTNGYANGYVFYVLIYEWSFFLDNQGVMISPK